MTKAELLLAIEAAKDETPVYIISPDGVGRPDVDVEVETDDEGEAIFLTYSVTAEVADE